MIILENVSKVFTVKSKEVKAVDNANIHVKKGEIHGVIGYSGAGKSTLIRCVNLLERPTSGKIVINGEEITCAFPKQVRSCTQKNRHDLSRLQLVENGNRLRQHRHPVKTSWGR